MKELVTVYKTYADANSSVKPLLEGNDSLALDYIVSGSHTDSEIIHPIELRVIEEDGTVSYFLTDDIFTVDTEEDDSEYKSYTTINDLVTAVIARIEYQARRFVNSVGYSFIYDESKQSIESDQQVVYYNLGSEPVFYTVEEDEVYVLDRTIKKKIKSLLGTEEGMVAGALPPAKKDNLKYLDTLTYVERGLSREERESFERAYQEQMKQLEC